MWGEHSTGIGSLTYACVCVSAKILFQAAEGHTAGLAVDAGDVTQAANACVKVKASLPDKWTCSYATTVDRQVTLCSILHMQQLSHLASGASCGACSAYICWLALKHITPTPFFFLWGGVVPFSAELQLHITTRVGSYSMMLPSCDSSKHLAVFVADPGRLGRQANLVCCSACDVAVRHIMRTLAL
jgi:hypothetical protein